MAPGSFAPMAGVEHDRGDADRWRGHRLSGGRYGRDREHGGPFRAR